MLDKIKNDLLNQIESTQGSICYISGPISRYDEKTIEQNLEIFHTVQIQLEESQKYSLVVNPASVGDLENSGATYDEILDMWLAILSHHKITTIVMLPDWKQSVGATKEFRLAKKRNLTIIEK